MGRAEMPQIEQYLTDYGWQFDRLGDGHWVTGWFENRTYNLVVRKTETFIDLSVDPLFQWDGVDDRIMARRLFRYINELNTDAPFLKVCVSKRRVILSAQLFSSGLNYEQFSSMLGLLGHYAEVFLDRVLNSQLRERQRKYSTPPFLT